MSLTNTSPERGIRPQTTRECHPRRSEDSWIELSSQPSSSSLSSAATTDDIITTGLRVQQLRRRRATHHHHHNHNHRVGYHVPPQDLEIGYSHRSSSTTGSSQDENEETESESDRLSNDDFPTRLQPDMNLLPEISSQSDGTLSTDDDDEDDEDDTSTALGFNPQPNAFSHPPASIRTTQSRNSLDSARLPQNRRNSRSSLPSMGSRRSSVQHSPFNMISPSHQADHDAALRASLSTLLSCAAAARGLPKNDSQPSVAERSPPRAEPSTFRLLPGANDTEDERIAQQMHVPPPPASAPSRFQPSASPSPSPKRSRSPTSTAAHGKARRQASPSKDRVSTKKAAQAMLSSSSSSSETATSSSSYRSISPTVMTWVISAGVVVLFSAISFSAGYVLGREVGRVESGQALYGNGLSNVSEPATSSFATLKSGAGCGREAIRGGLGRFRWTGGSVSA
ncbi:hypothetical protein TMEN_5858 [Trichophyton mentagrophytes]|nr:hypothetical protein TMEN_5858 [Trichophyton mentagrophytes]